jgi:hypothetical protein
MSVFAVILEIGLLCWLGGTRERARQALLPSYYREGLDALDALAGESPLGPGVPGFDSLARLVEECGVLYPLGRFGEDMGSPILVWMFDLVRVGDASEPRAIQRIAGVDATLLVIEFDRGTSITFSREYLTTAIERNPPTLSLVRVFLAVCAALALHGAFFYGVGAARKPRSALSGERAGRS